MELMVVRHKSANETTLGDIYYALTENQWTRHSYTLEDQIRETARPDTDDFAKLAAWVATWKVAKETATPAGRYPLKYTLSNRFQKYTLQVMNVPGFDGIRLHAGITDKDTEGCTILGYELNGYEIAHGTTRCAVTDLEKIVVPVLDKGEECWIQYENAA